MLAEIREFLVEKRHAIGVRDAELHIWLKDWLKKQLGVKWRSLARDSAIWAYFDSGELADIEKALSWVEQLESDEVTE